MTLATLESLAMARPKKDKPVGLVRLVLEGTLEQRLRFKLVALRLGRNMEELGMEVLMRFCDEQDRKTARK